MKLIPQHVNRIHAGAVYALAWDNETKTLFSGGADHVVASWSVDLQEQKGLTIRTSAAVYSMLFVPTSRKLFLGLNDGSLHVVDVNRKTEIAAIHLHNKAIYDLVYDHYNDWVWSCGGDGWIYIWDANTGSKVRGFPFSQERLRQLSIHPQEPKIAVAGERVWILDTSFANVLHSFKGHEQGATSVCWHPSKSVLLSGGKDGLVKAWSTASDTAALEIPAHRFAIYRLAIGSSGESLITASRDGTIKTWSIRDMTHESTIEKSNASHTHSVNTLMVTKEGIFTSSDDRRIRHWLEE